MLRKKKLNPPKKHDFAALDEAVSELNKQTSALLGPNHEEAKAKPTLPKKNTSPKSRAKSFDIIHTSSRSKPSNLKTAVVNKQTVLEPGHELLPEHAGLSFNEKAPAPISSPVQVESPAELSDETSAAITTHKAGLINTIPEPTLPVTPAPKEEEPQETEPDTPETKELSSAETTPQTEEPVKTKGAITFEPEEKEAPPKAATEPDALAETSEEPKGKPEEDVKAETPPEPAPSYESTGLYANNLVKNKDPKSYEPPETQQLPTVFDTNEYHEELHDWSKLDGGGAKIVLLILLLLVAGAAAYFVVSDQQLPF